MPEPSDALELQELVGGVCSVDPVFKIPESRGVLCEAVGNYRWEQYQGFNEGVDPLVRGRERVKPTLPQLVFEDEGAEEVGLGSVSPPSRNERAVMEGRLVFV